MRRKRFLLLLAIVALVGSACGGDTTTDETDGPTSTETSAPGAGGEVEVFSWWTAGGEAEGLEAMIEVFDATYPDFEFVNAAVAGGAGTNARAVLASRLAANDPPSSWQGHAGQELIGTYVAADQLEGLNFLYEEEGWFDVMPETLVPLISEDGEVYSVPVNIHRANVMWYLPDTLESADVEVPTTWDEFLEVAETLEAAGITPLAMGEQWTTLHLFETVLLGMMSPEAYNGLWDGTTDWAGSEVTAAIEMFGKVLDYTNSDSSTLAWEQATQLVIDGDAAFNVMGDWAEGYFKAQGLDPDDGSFGWAPSPGTDGMFQFLSDSFVLPKNAKNRDGAIAWLKVAGSIEGQDAFNPVKGSIPARTDGDASLYDAYLQSAMDDWMSDTVVGSLTHGVVANDNWKSEIDTSVGLYLTDGDAGALQGALASACASAGPCS
jgi:glucose/mannose transport system substrate-binding protein